MLLYLGLDNIQAILQIMYDKTVPIAFATRMDLQNVVLINSEVQKYILNVVGNRMNNPTAGIAIQGTKKCCNVLSYFCLLEPS